MFEGESMNTVDVNHLKIGQVLSQDIYNDLGNIILSAGTRLEARHIEYFKAHDIQHIFTQGELSLETVEEIVLPEEIQYLKKSYTAAIQQCKQMYYQMANEASLIEIEPVERNVTHLVEGILSDNDILKQLRTIRSEDSYLFTHMTNVAMLSAMLAKWMGYSQDVINDVALAGLLYDVGKARVPQELLYKKEPLTEKEYEAVHRHVIYGCEMAKANERLSDRVKNAICSHHERMDGSGYPLGLTGEKIPELARLLAVVDVFDAITSDRIYKPAISPFAAFKIIKEESFGRLDPEMCNVFMQNISAFFIHNRVRLSDGREGEVIYLNRLSVDRPLVKVGETFVDLSVEYGIEIEAVLPGRV